MRRYASIVSDALVQKNQQSRFAWVIAFKEAALWKGVGLAPGSADDMYSLHSKLCALLQVMIDSKKCAL